MSCRCSSSFKDPDILIEWEVFSLFFVLQKDHGMVGEIDVFPLFFVLQKNPGNYSSLRPSTLPSGRSRSRWETEQQKRTNTQTGV